MYRQQWYFLYTDGKDQFVITIDENKTQEEVKKIGKEYCKEHGYGYIGTFLDSSNEILQDCYALPIGLAKGRG